MKRACGLIAVCWLLACSDVTTNFARAGSAVGMADAGISSARDAGRDGNAARDAAGALDAGDAGPRQRAQCGGRACACDDGNDNDGDGLIDGLDPECTNPFDDDESSFATGAPAPPQSRCQDCFWDNNAGSGDDGCRYPTECLTGASPAKGSCGSCDVSQQCIDACSPRAPNGCDCFGCCEVRRPDGSRVSVQLRETCSLQKLDDEQACPRCVQSTSCFNDCGACELCPGRTVLDLPAECTGSGGGPRYRCNAGQQVCSPELPCPAGWYCQLGCCLYAVQ